jgi:hypothetical protein
MNFYVSANRFFFSTGTQENEPPVCVSPLPAKKQHCREEPQTSGLRFVDIECEGAARFISGPSP